MSIDERERDEARRRRRVMVPLLVIAFALASAASGTACYAPCVWTLSRLGTEHAWSRCMP